MGRGSDAGGAGPGWGGAWPGRGGAWPGGEQAQEVTAPVAERTRRRAGRGCRGCCGARTGAMENGAVYSPTTEENPGPARGSRSGLAAYCSLGRLPLLRRVLKGSQLVSRGAAGERGRPAWLPLGPRPSPASEGWGCSGRRRGARRFPASSLPAVLRLAVSLFGLRRAFCLSLSLTLVVFLVRTPTEAVQLPGLRVAWRSACVRPVTGLPRVLYPLS